MHKDIFYFLIQTTMARRPEFLTEDDVSSLLEWDSLVDSIEQILKAVSLKNTIEESLVIQPARGFMHMPHRNSVLLTMPGLSEGMKILSCKLVTSFLDNPTLHGLPSVLANILIFNPDTGKLRAIVEGTTITEWRTAAASVVATRALKPNFGKDHTLAVFGAGRQGRIHIIAFHHFFKLKKINLWNRTYEKGLKLAEELKQKNIQVEVYNNIAECARDADVIITATYSSKPILAYEQLKKGVMINAVGAGVRHHCELSKSIYERSSLYTDSIENAKVELKGLIDDGFSISGEIGQIIDGQKRICSNDFIIFHSLGMALEDGAAALLVLEKHLKKKGKQFPN